MSAASWRSRASAGLPVQSSLWYVLSIVRKLHVAEAFIQSNSSECFFFKIIKYRGLCMLCSFVCFFILKASNFFFIYIYFTSTWFMVTNQLFNICPLGKVKANTCFRGDFIIFYISTKRSAPMAVFNGTRWLIATRLLQLRIQVTIRDHYLWPQNDSFKIHSGGRNSTTDATYTDLLSSGFLFNPCFGSQ